MKRTWRNVEVENNTAERLKLFLDCMNYKYEEIQVFNLTHFKIFTNETEYKVINYTIDYMEEIKL